jgi:hypothetical protein
LEGTDVAETLVVLTRPAYLIDDAVSLAEAVELREQARSHGMSESDVMRLMTAVVEFNRRR